MKKMLFVLVAVILFVPNLVMGNTWLVKPDGTGDFPTIQAAGNAAVSGDIILLVDGIFTGLGNREIGFLGKQLTVVSQSGDPNSCIIDCEGAGRGFKLAFPDYKPKISGLTITNGRGYDATYGGGIWANGVSPEISNCIVSNCQAATGGGGICIMYAPSALVKDCLVTGNSAGYLGGGMMMESVDGEVVVNCTITGNQCGSQGGGLHFSGGTPVIEGSLIAGNTAAYGGGISSNYYVSPIINSCTIVNNTGDGIWAGSQVWNLSNTIIASNTGKAIYIATATVNLNCCDLWGNGLGNWVGSIAGQLGLNGNICENPLFCSPDYTIDASSPCAPAHSQGCGLIGALGVGCGEPTETKGGSWGKLKALYK